MKKALSGFAILAACLSYDARSEGFAGLAVGAAEWPSDACIASGGCDRRDTAWSGRLGYMFSPYVGVEARYVDLGRARSSTSVVSGSSIDSKIDAKGAGVGLALALPVADRFRLTGVAGVARMRTRLDTPDVTIPGDGGVVTVVGFHETETKTKPYYGVGFDYAFTPDWSAGVEATRYRVGLAGTADADTVMASVTYRFR